MNTESAGEYIPAPAPREAPELVMPEALEDRLAFNQRMRTKIVDHLTTGGTAIPKEEEDVKLLLQTLREQDSVTLGEMKVRLEGQGVANDQLVQAAILEMTRSRTQLALAKPLPVAIERDIPDSPELAADVSLVPDETLIGQQNLSYADFREKFGKA